MSAEEMYDVIIIGGGPAGLAVGSELAEALGLPRLLVPSRLDQPARTLRKPERQDQEHQAREQELQADHLVVDREDVLAQKALVVVPVVVDGVVYVAALDGVVYALRP